MSLYDFNAPRLFWEGTLTSGISLSLDRTQSNYLINVLRLRSGNPVLVFNGHDGEWLTELILEGRKSVELLLKQQVREQTNSGDLLYMFAPIKHARLDYMVQKAVEMGVAALQPVFTHRTQSNRVNLERMRANAVEAAEQCGILTLPEIVPEMKLAQALAALEPDRLLVFCDEDAPVANPIKALSALKNQYPRMAVIIGPEGGFSEEERKLIGSRQPNIRISLGPRILRADTAAIAALSVIQAVLGDWGEA